jgi:hypothetical protein
MNDTHPSETGADALSHEDMQAALFAQLVMQQTNLALMLLGKMPNPQSGETTRDLDSARLFIDQLEMIEAKTKGNLSRDESHLLQQSLMALRMAFVEAVESPAKPAEQAAGAKPQPTVAESKAAPAEPASAATAEESPKRFSKKY